MLNWVYYDPAEPTFITFIHGIEYIIHHQHKPIISTMKIIFKTNKSPLQCFFNTSSADINQTQEYSNFLHTYCDVDHAGYLRDRLSVNSTSHLFNGTIIDWCANNQSVTSQDSSKEETREMYTGVLYQN